MEPSLRSPGTTATCPSTARSPTRCSPSSTRDPDAAVFFHDYHLYLAPQLVRDERPDARLRALHPHPVAAARLLARAAGGRARAAMHEGLLANDVVGFHTDRWRRNFVHACSRSPAPSGTRAGVLQHDGRRTHVVTRPISIDPDEFEALARAPGGARGRSAGSSRSGPEQLSLRVDRTDPSKNVVRGFRAFELLLERHPERAGRVGMLALLDPSRQTIPRVRREYLGAIQREARALNERFGRDGWQPIDLRVGDNFVRSVAAYKQFDVLLVNPIFDGHEPRREGGAARERARRRRRALRERRRARGARRLGVTSTRSTSRARPRRSTTALTMPPTERAPPARSRRSAATCASTTSSAGVAPSSTTSTAACRAPRLGGYASAR